MEHVEAFARGTSRLFKRLAPFFTLVLYLFMLLPWFERPFWCVHTPCDLNLRFPPNSSSIDYTAPGGRIDTW